MNEKFEIVHKVVDGRLVAIFIPIVVEEEQQPEEVTSNE